MTISDTRKTPFPYFGGKADAAGHVWRALGDCEHYVEPFAGSLAVLLRRPHECNRAYFSETVNDMDGLLCNAWRSMQLSPDATAEAASWPVCEADLHARHLAIVRFAADRDLERLMGDPLWHDPVIAGFWIWGCSCWIGGGWASGKGPWIVGGDGRICKRDGRDDPGVKGQKPVLAGNGQGANNAGAREPGVSRKIPHLGDGRGVNNVRASGVVGVEYEPGDWRDRVIADYGASEGYHPMTMPEIRRWFHFLAARLRHVRILNGDWARAVTGSASKTLGVRMNGGVCGVFLDPPYSHAVRDGDLYACESITVADDVRAWCIEHGDDPQYRIVLAGYAAEHGVLKDHGWREVGWFRKGFLKGGMAQHGAGGTRQGQERLWLSPHCLTGEETPKPSKKPRKKVEQGGLFG